MKESIRKELASISPLLTSLNEKQKDAAIPENYFTEMQTTVLSKINNEQKSDNTKQSNNLFSARFTVAIAASLAIIIGVGLYFFSTPTQNATEELTLNEIQNYIESNIDEYDIDMIEDFVMEENTRTTIPDEIDNEMIIDYLNEQVDDFDDSFFEELY